MQKNFVIRTVKNGRVKINSRFFRPRETYRPYNGELEGLRLAFGLYSDALPDKDSKVFVSLWGTEEEYYNPDELEELSKPYIIDGYHVWMWWGEV